jgi:hypothetical protein
MTQKMRIKEKLTGMRGAHPRVLTFGIGLAIVAAVGALSVVLIPVQTANAQTVSEYALIIRTLCGGEPEIKDDKIECPSGIEFKDVNSDGNFEKFEAPPLQCEEKEDKDECPEEE